MKRKVLILIMTAVLCFGITACGNNENKQEEQTQTIGEEIQAESGEAPSEPESTEEIKPAGELKVEIPEGFLETDENTRVYVTKDYPKDSSMIVIEETDQIQALPTKEQFKAQIESGLTKQAGEPVEVNVEEYKDVEVDGYKALRIMSSYTYSGIKFKQLEYVVEADKTYLITYTNINDANWMDAFEQSAAGIHFE